MNAYSLFVADPWNWFLLDVTAKATLLLLVAAGIAWLSGRSSAALRHRVWTLSFIALLLLPIVDAVAPGWGWQIIPRHWQPAPTTVRDPVLVPNRESFSPEARTDVGPVPISAASATISNAGSASNPALVPSAIADAEPTTESANAAVSPTSTGIPDQSAVWPSTRWISFIWLSGALLALIPLATGMIGNVRLRRRARRLCDDSWVRLVARLSQQLGLRRQVTLLVTDPQQMPMTFGTWKPVVILPNEAIEWSAERREIVLLHELAHVKRWDVPLQMLARLTTAIYWFHPLVWWSVRRMRSEREHACDDCVLLAGQRASDYAGELLEIARRHRSLSPLLNAALSMARQSQLEGRLLAVLDAQRCRTPVGASWTGGLLALTLALVVGLGVVRPTLQAKTPSPAENTSSIAAPSPAVDPSRQMVITGVVLSPEGKPVAATNVEFIALDRYDHWERNLPEQDGFERHETTSDARGRFRLSVPRDVSHPHALMTVVASDAHQHLAMHPIDQNPTQSRLELKFEEQRPVRIQLIDLAGNPAAGVEPQLKSASLAEGRGLGELVRRKGNRATAAWPRFSRSDERGYASITLPASTKEMTVVIDDERVGRHLLQLKISDKTIIAALKLPHFLKGKVTAADSGKPIAGAEVALIETPYRRVRTDADGIFRLASGAPVRTLFREGESIVHIYPPPESDYLYQAREWKWPNDGIGDAELSIKLKRGIVVEGQVIEKATGTPVVGASVYFELQQKGNPYFSESARSRFLGSDMKYATDAQGRFRIPVWPGPGHLLVNAPTLDYVHTQVSMGEQWYGKPGLQREYYDGALRIELKPDEHPQPFTIPLERGVTLRRKVVRPDGQPARGKAYARSYLKYKKDINQWLPEISIEEGLLELPGFEPKHTNPVFILDLEHHCGTAVSPTVAAADGAGPPIQLQPCGAAKFRFVNDQGKPLTNYEPSLYVVVTPGATATHFIEPDRPLWVNSLNWQTIVHFGRVARTNAEGRVTVNDLIPGATYRLSFVNKKGMFDDGYEFTVAAGATTDVGKVVLPQRD